MKPEFGRTHTDSIEQATLSAALRRAAKQNYGDLVEEADPATNIVVVKRYIRQRDLRAKIFPPGLLADPAWDILVDLYAATAEGAQVSVSSACIAARVPATTALRWVGKLCEEGMINRHSDPLDGRRHFLTLTPVAVEALNRWFARA